MTVCGRNGELCARKTSTFEINNLAAVDYNDNDNEDNNNKK